MSRTAITAYLRGFGGGWYVTGLCAAMLLFPAANVLNNWWLSVWVGDSGNSNSGDDDDNDDDDDDATRSSLFYVEVYVGLCCATAVVTLARNWLFVVGAVRGGARLHDALLTRVFAQASAFFDTHAASALVNRFAKDIATVDESVSLALNYLTQTSLTLLATLVIVAWVTPYVLAVIAVIAVPAVVVANYYR